MTSHKEATPRDPAGRAELPSTGGGIDRDLAAILADLAREWAAIDDLDSLCSTIAERAVALVGADRGAVSLGEYTPSTDTAPSQLAIRLVLGTEVLGVLIVERHRVVGPEEPASAASSSGFSGEDEHRLTMLASVAVLAIAGLQRADSVGRNLHERLQRLVLQQEKIIRFGDEMRSGDEVETVLQEVAASALTAIPTASTTAVHLFDKETGVLQRHGCAGSVLREQTEPSFAFGRGIARHALATRQTVNVADVLKDRRHAPESGHATYRSVLVAPLIAREKPLGTLGAGGLEPSTFGPHDEQMIRALAAQAATVLHNAELHAHTSQLAAELEAAYRQMHDLARRKNQFIQNTSHELRTPLTLVQGYLEMLQSGGFGQLSGAQQEVVGFLCERSQQLADLVNDIACLAEVELYAEDVERLDLTAIVAGSVLAQREQFDKAGVVVETEWPATPPFVRGNQYRLMQVFYHLLNNAIKFSPRGGRVHIRVWSERDHALVRVTDQGIGIPREEQERIFDRFYQVDGSTTRRFTGIGLGLAIVKETVEAHEGVVQVESRGAEGEGTTFTVILPLMKDDDAQDQM